MKSPTVVPLASASRLSVMSPVSSAVALQILSYQSSFASNFNVLRFSTSVQQDQTDAVKMAWAYVMGEGRQTGQKRSLVETKREKIKRTTKQKMDGLC